MPKRSIVSGQKVTEIKRQRARELRRQMTPEECILWEHLRGHQLRGLHFRRQQVIDGYIADFYCTAAALVVEVDGPAHAAQAEYDAERDRAFARHGLRVIRIRNEDVTRDLAGVLERIASAAEGGDTGDIRGCGFSESLPERRGPADGKEDDTGDVLSAR